MTSNGVRSVIEIFNRDITQIYKSKDARWRFSMLVDAVEFYTNEMSLPDDHQGKTFSEYEYRLIIKLYQNELIQHVIGDNKMKQH